MGVLGCTSSLYVCMFFLGFWCSCFAVADEAVLFVHAFLATATNDNGPEREKDRDRDRVQDRETERDELEIRSELGSRF